jgi:hypothetical protein
LQQQLGVSEVEEVIFVEQSAEAFRYRDAVRFSNGRETLQQDLHSGQCVEVLTLDSTQAEPEQRMGMSMPADCQLR